MDRKTYIETVLSALRHVTRREREAIRAEIDGHIEDHMADLLELDYPPELAEERTLSAMGDPAEVGRELNEQYTGWGWVILSRVLLAALVAVCAVVLCSNPSLYGLRQNLEARKPLEWRKWAPADRSWTSGSLWEMIFGISMPPKQKRIQMGIPRSPSG